MDSLAQDLQLINDLVDVPQSSGKAESPPSNDLDASIESSGEDSSDSSSVSSDSDSESDILQVPKREVRVVELPDEDLEEEGGGPATSAGTHLTTKNEVLEPSVNVPTIESVGADELLESVGDIMSIIANTVVVRATAAVNAQSVLDTDTLLVFDDRKVLGYICDTFGPTSLPLYQLRFSKEYPLDPEKVRVSRQVFHVPQQSHYISLNQITRFKGSDASDMHDEEPGEDEVEFSDDEAEAAHRALLKQKRRRGSVVSSRHGTPASSRDQDNAYTQYTETNAFDEHSPYDLDYGAGSSIAPVRSAPLPYDDPYADSNTEKHMTVDRVPSQSSNIQRSVGHPPPATQRPQRPLRGRGHGGRGRGRGREPSGSSGSSAPQPPPREGYVAMQSNPYQQSSHFPSMPPPPTPYQQQQYLQQQYLLQQQQQQQQQQHLQQQQQQHSAVQPHINPRFAAQFSFGFGMPPYGAPPNGPAPGPSGNWDPYMPPPPGSS